MELRALHERDKVRANQIPCGKLAGNAPAGVQSERFIK
jgi:hypothetical protein